MLDLSGHDYRLTLLAGTVFSLASLACLVRLQAGTAGRGRGQTLKPQGSGMRGSHPLRPARLTAPASTVRR